MVVIFIFSKNIKMGKSKCGCPPLILPPISCPVNPNSNFAGTWNVEFNFFAVLTTGETISPQSVPPVTVTITPTTDKRFYSITTNFQGQEIQLVGVVGIRYDNCGRQQGYYLLNNGPVIPENALPVTDTQLIRELTPVAWDSHGNPTRLEGVATTHSTDIGNTTIDGYGVLYGTWTRV